MSNVIEFQRPRPVRQAAPKAAPKPAPKLTTSMNRREWTAALAAIWANPRNWRRSKRGNAYIVIGDLEICVVIAHGEDGFKWEIRWSWSKEPPIVSRWIYMVEQTAIDEAWDALVALA